jgi:hypothetical protein
MNKSYDNAYRLMIGEIDYKELGNKFWLPVDHEDPNVLLNHYESEEEYEKCNNIVKIITKGKRNE